MTRHLFSRGTRHRLFYPTRLATPGLCALLAGASWLAAHGTLTAGESDTAKDKAVVEKKAESRIKFSVFTEFGVTGNFNDPNDHQNFGRVFDDRANEPLLNQVTATLERALAPEPGKFDWGFKLQAGIGSDGRFVNTLGTLENVNRGVVMPYVVEAYGSVHFPLTFLNKDAGIDIRLGQFITIIGQETIDPRTNFFYSHDYIFNFGIPLQHLGGYGIIHVNPTLDLYAGLTRGVNTAFFDNNGKVAFLGGVGLNNLLGGKLTLLATTHIGPENPYEATGAAAYHGSGFVKRSDLRYYGDLLVTYKFNDKLTSITEGVYTYDSGFDTDFYGAATTLAYTLNDKVTVAVRGEVVRDSDGFYVAQFGAFDDFTNLERGGIPLDKRTVGGGPNTYVEATVGVQIKPIKYLTVRPEVRFDHSFQSGPFDDGSKQWSVTVGADAIIAF